MKLSTWQEAQVYVASCVGPPGFTAAFFRELKRPSTRAPRKKLVILLRAPLFTSSGHPSAQRGGPASSLQWLRWPLERGRVRTLGTGLGPGEVGFCYN